MSCLKITWDDISFPPVNLWVVTDVSYFYRKAGENMSTEESGFAVLRDAINTSWKGLYGEEQEDVQSIPLLVNRVKYIANDRDCWVFNAKAASKEIEKLRGGYVNNS